MVLSRITTSTAETSTPRITHRRGCPSTFAGRPLTSPPHIYGTPAFRYAVPHSIYEQRPFRNPRGGTIGSMTEATLYGGVRSRRVTVRDLQLAKQRGERWPMLTSYDMLTAGLFDEAGVPVLLVGDSAANNVLGYETTVPVTVDELLPLVRAVVRSTSR